VIAKRTLAFIFFLTSFISFMGCQTLTPEQYAALPNEQSAIITIANGRSVRFPTELLTLKTRPMTRQRFLWLTPPTPTAVVLLFPGQDGRIALVSHGDSLTLNEENFLVRTRERFAEKGFAVAVIDTDKSGGIDEDFRMSDEALTDIDAVIRFARSRFSVPVWVIGTSKGTVSAAAVAAGAANGVDSTPRDGAGSIGGSKHQKIDGLVLTSSRLNVTNVPLERIVVPVLIIAHSKDACGSTPPWGAAQIARRLVSAPVHEVQMFSEFSFDKRGQRNKCGPFAAHGFFGAESSVLSAIASFISRQPPAH
jgi:hypothetical protein